MRHCRLREEGIPAAESRRAGFGESGGGWGLRLGTLRIPSSRDPLRQRHNLRESKRRETWRSGLSRRRLRRILAQGFSGGFGESEDRGVCRPARPGATTRDYLAPACLMIRAESGRGWNPPPCLLGCLSPRIGLLHRNFMPRLSESKRRRNVQARSPKAVLEEVLVRGFPGGLQRIKR